MLYPELLVWEQTEPAHHLKAGSEIRITALCTFILYSYLHKSSGINKTIFRNGCDIIFVWGA